MVKIKMKLFLVAVAFLFLPSCYVGGGVHTSKKGAENKFSLSSNADKETMMDEDVSESSIITGVGYAVVSSQIGETYEQRRLLAIRVARLAAIRDLAEQIHGLKVNSDTTITDILVQNDSMRVSVSGLVRGARTVRINPLNDDTYEVVVEVNIKNIIDALKVAVLDN